MKRLIPEVHRRSLWQVMGIYLMGSRVVLQVADGELQPRVAAARTRRNEILRARG